MFLNVPWQQRVKHTHTQTHTLESVHDRSVRVENLSWQGQTEKSLSAAPQIVSDWVTFKDKKKIKNLLHTSTKYSRLFPRPSFWLFLSIWGNKNVTILTSECINCSPKPRRHRRWRPQGIERDTNYGEQQHQRPQSLFSPAGSNWLDCETAFRHSHTLESQNLKLFFYCRDFYGLNS